MRNHRRALFGSVAVAALGACALAAAARRSPAPSDALLLSTVVRDDPAHKAQEPAAFGVLAQPEGPSREDPDAFDASRVTCDDGVAAVKQALTRADDGFTSHEVLRLCTLTQLAASRGAECAARLRDELASSSSCGRAYGAVASCVVSSPNFAAAWTRSVFEAASATCRPRLVSSLHQARHVDLRLVKAVAPFAGRQTKEGFRSRVLLALGSLERTAREQTPPASDAVSYVDALLGRELHGSTGLERQVMLEAAGNAACVSCLKDIQASLHEDNPILRRSATGALRFYEAVSELDALCSAAAGDASELVREQAVWSLRWSPAHEAPRSLCLVGAARNDPSASVRATAVQSLVALSGASPSAVAALADLNVEELERTELLAAVSDTEQANFDPFGRGEAP